MGFRKHAIKPRVDDRIVETMVRSVPSLERTDFFDKLVDLIGRNLVVRRGKRNPAQAFF